MGLREEDLLVLHVFGTFNRENSVEHTHRKIVIRPVAQKIVRIASVPASGQSRGDTVPGKS